MMLMKLKNYFFRPHKNEAGSLTRGIGATSACYQEIDLVNRWQGDLFPSSSFASEGLPTKAVPYWLLANRTCQLVEERGVKLTHLVFIATYPIDEFVIAEKGAKSLKNQISEILSKTDSCLYLPPSPDSKLVEHVVADFNLL
ncbi:MAG: hypothetical protein H7256_12755, partial [Bdellovibrio sp.]|nr:hypothetical protein [Bdellovibrio sp.]